MTAITNFPYSFNNYVLHNIFNDIYHALVISIEHGPRRSISDVAKANTMPCELAADN